MAGDFLQISATEIFQGGNVGLAIVNEDLIVDTCNDRLKRWIAIPEESPLGLPVTQVFPELVGLEATLLKLLSQAEESLTIAKIYRPPFEPVTADEGEGEVLGRYFDLQIESLLSPNQGLLILVNDVSAQAYLELALRQERNELRLEVLTRQAAEEALQDTMGLLGLKVEEQTASLVEINARLNEELTQRRRMEVSLRTSEEQFRIIFEQSFDAMLVADRARHTILQVNQQARRILGYPRQTLIGKPLSALLPANNHQRRMDFFKMLQVRGVVLEDQSFLCADGSICMVELTTTPIPWGQAEANLITFWDITGRQHTEEILLQRAALLAMINDIGGQISAVLALEDVLSRTVQLVQRTFDYHLVSLFMLEDENLVLQAGATQGKSRLPLGYVHDTSRGIIGWVASHGRKIVANDVQLEARYIARIDQDFVTRSELCLPIKVANELVGVLDVQSMHLDAFGESEVIAMEILTDQIAVAIENARLYEAVHQELLERERAEATLQRRNRELALLNEIIMVSGLEPEAVFNMACRELVQIFDVSRGLAILLDQENCTASVIADYLSTKDDLQLFNNIVTLEEATIRFLSESKAPFQITDLPQNARYPAIDSILAQENILSVLLLPLLIEEQTVGVLIFGTTEGRTFSSEELLLGESVAQQVAGGLARARLNEERRALERQYHQAQKMEAMGRLAGGVAHDFNNLLTVIISYSDLLLYSLEKEADRAAVTEISRSGKRAAALTQQLLTFTRHQMVRPLVINLREIILTLKNMLEPIIGEDIQLNTKLDDELWFVKLDPAQVELMLVNLTINARDAMPDGGQLFIEATNVVLSEEYTAQHLDMHPGEYVLLSVGDTGYGMNDEVKSHIFEPFFTTKEVGKGTGLGLATVFGIVKQAGGSIWVYSEEGVGTTFKIYLPRSTESILPVVQIEGSEDVPFGYETILLVEDDAEVRELVRLVLEGQGYDLIEAPNGQMALKVAKDYNSPIHLLLTDVIMPGMNGLVLAEQMRQTHSSLKILFMSGYTQNTVENYGLLKPGVTLLQKPFSPKALARMVREILDS